MSKDVSITDLIAEARKWRSENPDDPNTEIVSERVTSLIARLTDALEPVTVPTENAYDVAYMLYGELDTLGVEGTDPRRECFEAGWAAAIARLPVPVEPEHKWLFSHRQRAAQADWEKLSAIPGVTNPEGRDSFIKGFHRGVNAKDRAVEPEQITEGGTQ